MIAKIAHLVGSLCLLGLMLGAGFFASDRVERTLQHNALLENINLPEVADLPDTVETRQPPKRPDIYYDAIAARPLFSPTRRPTQAISEVVVVPDTVDKPVITMITEQPDIALGGVLGSVDERKALILFSDASTQWLKLGDTVEGWEITEISDKTITLSSDTRTFRLELFQ